MAASDTYILEDAQGNEYEIDSSIDPKVAAEKIKSAPAPVVRSTAATPVSASAFGLSPVGYERIGATEGEKRLDSTAWAVAKGLAPVAVDALMTMALPETALLKIAKIPGFSTLANKVVSRWGPEMLRRMVGAFSGTLTAGAVGGPKAAGGYLALSAAPGMSAAELERQAIKAGVGIGGQMGARAVGGAAGGLTGTVAASGIERGELPSLPEAAINATLGGVFEPLAGIPGYVERAVGVDPVIAALKQKYPQLANVPDILFQKDTTLRRVLESFQLDPLLNPTLQRHGEDLAAGMKSVATERLGVRPPAEVMAGPTAPNMDAIRNAADQVVQGFEPAVPEVLSPPMSSPEVLSEMTSRLNVPEPAPARSALPPSTPATVQDVGVQARGALQNYYPELRQSGQDAYQAMLDQIRSTPATPLPIEPFQEGIARAKAIAGEAVIPEGGTRALKTVGNVEKATASPVDEENLQQIFDLFPDLTATPGMGEFGEGTGLSRVDTHRAERLLRDLSAAKRLYGGYKSNRIVREMEKATWQAIAQSDMPAADKDRLLKGRQDYAIMSEESSMVRGEAFGKTAKTKPDILGRRVAAYNPEEVSLQTPNTIFNSLSKAGFDVHASAKNLLINDFARKIDQGEDVTKVLRDAAKSPLFSPEEQAAARAGQAQWEAFLANPQNEGKAKQYLDVLTGKGAAPGGPAGTEAVNTRIMEEASSFARTLPAPVQVSIGRLAARNVLAKGVQPVTPVAGGPTILAGMKGLTDSMVQNMAGLSLLPQDELSNLFAFAAKSSEALNDVDKVADTIAKLYDPKNYAGMSNLFQDYFKAADPRNIRQVRDLLKKVPGGEQAWNDFATAQLSTNMFHGEDFSAEKLIKLFQDESGKMVPRETLDILTEHIPPENRQALFDLYDVAERTLDFQPGKPNPALSAARTAASAAKTAREATGLQTAITRILPAAIGAGIGSPGGIVPAAIGAGLGAALSIGSTAAMGMLPLIVGKAILTKGNSLRRWVAPIVQSLENVGMQGTAGGSARLGGNR